MTWNPSLYLSFNNERTRAAADLVARVPLATVRRATDLGCGPANSTALLAARWPDAQLAGVDLSAEMIAAARQAMPAAQFALGDFEQYSPPPDLDLVFANAAFQWSSDPVGLAARLLRELRPGAVLALQVPQNYDQPSHNVIEQVVREGPWAATLAKTPTYDPGGFARAQSYARALSTMGALDIWTTDYLHILHGEDPVFRWMSGTGLRPFLAQLSRTMRAEFEAAAKEAYRVAYPAELDGTTHYPFRRLFVIAVRTS